MRVHGLYVEIVVLIRFMGVCNVCVCVWLLFVFSYISLEMFVGPVSFFKI